MTTSLLMVVAWVLGVVATLGVGAFAIWRGQLWFYDPHIASPAVALFDESDDTARRAISKYLRGRFDEIDYATGAIHLTGLAYVGEPIVEVRNDRLQRAMPGTRFFRSGIANPNYLRPQVETLISVRHESGQDDIRLLLSPGMERPSHKFFAQFIGVSAPTPADTEAIASGLADLLAAITYGGDVEIASDGRGCVNQVVVKNAADPRDDVLVTNLSASVERSSSAIRRPFRSRPE
jgi:hypothetical protein